MQNILKRRFLSGLQLSVILTAMTSFCALSVQANSDAAVELESLLWEKRVVIGRPVNDAAQQNLIDLLNVYQQELKERRLLFILPVGDQWIAFPTTATSFSNESVSAKFNKTKQNEYVLIGLDGEVKQRFHDGSFELAKIFDQIDLMPMRKSELKEEAEKNH
jgi:hypothetical protein